MSLSVVRPQLNVSVFLLQAAVDPESLPSVESMNDEMIDCVVDQSIRMIDGKMLPV